MCFVAKWECSGQVHFAPLGGGTYHRLFPEAMRSFLPDSLLVRTPDGTRLVRSAAVLHLLGLMGVGWRLAGRVLAWLPAAMLDGAYDWVARRRHRCTACTWRPSGNDPRFED